MEETCSCGRCRSVLRGRHRDAPRGPLIVFTATARLTVKSRTIHTGPQFPLTKSPEKWTPFIPLTTAAAILRYNTPGQTRAHCSGLQQLVMTCKLSLDQFWTAADEPPTDHTCETASTHIHAHTCTVSLNIKAQNKQSSSSHSESWPRFVAFTQHIRWLAAAKFHYSMLADATHSLGKHMIMTSYHQQYEKHHSLSATTSTYRMYSCCFYSNSCTCSKLWSAEQHTHLLSTGTCRQVCCQGRDLPGPCFGPTSPGGGGAFSSLAAQVCQHFEEGLSSLTHDRCCCQPLNDARVATKQVLQTRHSFDAADMYRRGWPLLHQSTGTCSCLSLQLTQPCSPSNKQTVVKPTGC
jgi:hypothetical protein